MSTTSPPIESRVSFLQSIEVAPHGESVHKLYRLDLKDTFRWPTVVKDGFINGREYDHNTRVFRCEELRAKRAALRLMRELGFGPTRINSSYSPTGRWFCSGAEIIHVDPIYCYAIIKSEHSLDC